MMNEQGRVGTGYIPGTYLLNKKVGLGFQGNWHGNVKQCKLNAFILEPIPGKGRQGRKLHHKQVKTP